MTTANSNPLDLLGKYVSFEEISVDGRELPSSEYVLCKGLIEEVSVALHDKVSIRLVDEFYGLSDIRNFKVLGELQFQP